MELKSRYKETEVGVIPEDWEVIPLGKGLSGKPSYGINAPAVQFSDRLPIYIRITDITEDGRYNPSSPVSVKSPDSENYYLEDGDIVFARTGASVGKSYLYRPSDGELVFAGFLIRVHPDSVNLLAPYIAAYVTTGPYWRWVQLMSTRSGQPGINGKEYALLPIPKPPIAEQHAIATALNDADALLDGLDRLIAKKRDLKQAAMQQLLTGKTRLPGFEGEWEVKLLVDIADIVMGQSPNSSNYNSKGDGLPLIQGNADIVDRRTIKRIFTTQITKRGKEGDVLMSVRAPVGEISRALFDVCLGRGVCAIRFPNDFLYHLLIFLEPSWTKHSKGSTFDSVNFGDIKAVEVDLPSDPKEQTAVAAVLTDMDAEITALEERRQKTKNLKQAMMQELLTGKTRLVEPEELHA